MNLFPQTKTYRWTASMRKNSTYYQRNAYNNKYLLTPSEDTLNKKSRNNEY